MNEEYDRDAIVDEVNDLSRPHFEGLWVTDLAQIEERYNQGLEQRPKALLFLGNCYMLAFELWPSNKDVQAPATTHILWHYHVTPSAISFKSGSESEMTEYESAWRALNGPKLETEIDGMWFRYEPTTWGRLVDLGFDEDTLIKVVTKAKQVPLSYNIAPKFPEFVRDS